MGKVIIETEDKGELRLKTSLTLKQIEKIIKDLEKKEKAKKLVESTFGTIKENKNLENKLKTEWYRN